jgi:hypothetical protein
MSVATKTRIALVANAEGIASVTGKLFTALPTDTSADPTVTRALDTATRINSAGNIETVVANKGRISYELGINKCPNLLVERSVAGIRNSTGAGVVAGTPGTLPTNWATSLNGLTQQIIGTGTENGIPYIDFKLSGTATGTNVRIIFEAGSQITAANGQIWTESIYAKLIDTTLPPTAYLLQVFETTSGGVFVTVGNVNFTPNATLTRYEFTRTLNGGGTVGAVQPMIQFTVVNGQSYDFTIRVGIPQMEQSAFATSPIFSNNVSTTRNADVITKTAISSIIPQTKGGLFFDGYLQAGSLSDGVARNFFNVGVDSNNRINLFRLNNQITLSIVLGGVTQVEITTNITIPLLAKRIKLFVFYDTNNVAFYINDLLIGVDNSVSLPSLPDLLIGQRFGGAGFWDGLIKTVAVTDELDATEIDKLFQFSSYADMAAEMLYTTN